MEKTRKSKKRIKKSNSLIFLDYLINFGVGGGGQGVERMCTYIDYLPEIFSLEHRPLLMYYYIIQRIKRIKSFDFF